MQRWTGLLKHILIKCNNIICRNEYSSNILGRQTVGLLDGGVVDGLLDTLEPVVVLLEGNPEGHPTEADLLE